MWKAMEETLTFLKTKYIRAPIYAAMKGNIRVLIIVLNILGSSLCTSHLIKLVLKK